jgi:1,2-diacylglycerol 3-alpha-glucosyltransferase
MSLKHVVHITNNFTPYMGGVTRAIQTITQGLRTQGLKTTIVTLDFTGQQYANEQDVLRLPTIGKIIYKNNPLAYPLNCTRTLFKMLTQLAPDIIHFHHPFLLGNSGLFCARQLGIPTVFTYHTLYHRYTHYVPLPHWITARLINHRLKQFCNEVHGIITPSTAAHTFIASLGHAHKATVLPTPIQSHFLLSEKPEKPLITPIELLYVGRFVHEKSPAALLELYKLLPPHLFRLTYAGYGYLEAHLKHLAYKTYQLSPAQVRFIIKPTQDELLNFYRISHFFLFPSQTDTQGLVLAEAMAQGTPVIALPGPGQADLIKTGYNGAIVPSVQAMAHYITSIAHNSSAYAILSRNAYTSHFTYHPETYIENLLSFYEKAALRAKNSRPLP